MRTCRENTLWDIKGEKDWMGSQGWGGGGRGGGGAKLPMYIYTERPQDCPELCPAYRYLLFYTPLELHRAFTGAAAAAAYSPCSFQSSRPIPVL